MIFRLQRFLILPAALAIAAYGQATHPVTGRPIATVMGMGGADWLERTERVSEEAPDRALDALDIKPGTTVADVGAGVGYLTVRLAKRVGPTGKVYANDIQPGMLERLKKNIEANRLANVETVLGTETDPRLPPSAIDLVLLVDVYHELSQPQAMLAKIREALKPDGRLVLFEYKKEDPAIPIREEHKMSVADVKTELEAEGFRLVKVHGNLPRQHILVFRKSLM
jgi:ubiquinone/menaquinone biosynthesis C-methylase UbiE